MYDHGFMDNTDRQAVCKSISYIYIHNYTREILVIYGKE